MAVERQQQFLGQMRVDAPHLRALESGVASDFDTLAGVVMAGKLAVVVSGFDIVATGAIGADAENLVLRVAGASAIHYEAAEAGSIFRVPEDRADEVLEPTNPVVTGSFTPNSTNFVGLDFTRLADDTTADTVQFLASDTSTETPAVVPLARTLDYRIVITTTEFSAAPGLAPLAKVITDASNKVVSIEDARHLLFRLGRGGSSPLAVNPFGWPGGRNEASSSLASVAGDRSITSLKDWLNAAMTRLWEIGGGEYWYSPTADRNVSLTSNAVFLATGEPFWVNSSNLLWTGLRFVFDNSTATTNEIANQLTASVGLTDLADGECLYVDLDRTQNRTVAGANPLQMQKAVLASVGTSARPGQRHVVAWRSGSQFYTRNQYLPIGSALRVATTAANGVVRLAATPVSSVAPVVPARTIWGVMGMEGFSREDTGTTGDLYIGLGQGSDHNIELRTFGSLYQTRIIASSRYSVSQRAGLKVIQNGNAANRFDARIVDFDALTDTTKTRFYVESGGAIGMSPWEEPPVVVAPTASDPARMKFGTRPSRFWKTDVRLATAASLPAYTGAGSGPSRTLTATSNGALTVDSVLVATNDRILVRLESGADDGIYVVTSTGSAGTPYVLTRASDCNEQWEVFQDIAVKVTAGTANAGKAYVMTHYDSSFVNILTTPFVLETDIMSWDETTNLTRDLVVVRWFDNTETVVAQGPAYFV